MWKKNQKFLQIIALRFLASEIELYYIKNLKACEAKANEIKYPKSISKYYINK